MNFKRKKLNTNKIKVILSIFLIILTLISPFTAITTYFAIEQVNNIKKPTFNSKNASIDELENNLNDFQTKMEFYIYFFVFNGIFHVFTGVSVLSGLHTVFNWSFIITILEILTFIVGLFIYLSIRYYSRKDRYKYFD